MNEAIALALIFASALTIPAMWLFCFLKDPWPDGCPPMLWLFEVTYETEEPR